MKKQLTKLALTAALGLALTILACEDKEKKQTPTTEPAAAETQQPSQEAASESQSGMPECPKKEGPHITIEAVFLENTESGDGFPYYAFRLPNGETITFEGEVNDLKEGDKVSITYNVKNDIWGDGYELECTEVNNMISWKKIGK